MWQPPNLAGQEPSSSHSKVKEEIQRVELVAGGRRSERRNELPEHNADPSLSLTLLGQFRTEQQHKKQSIMIRYTTLCYTTHLGINITT